jgi:hypothetical protein
MTRPMTLHISLNLQQHTPTVLESLILLQVMQHEQYQPVLHGSCHGTT